MPICPIREPKPPLHRGNLCELFCMNLHLTKSDCNSNLRNEIAFFGIRDEENDPGVGFFGIRTGHEPAHRMQGGIECRLDGTGACPSFVASSSMCDACDSLSISRSIHLSLYAQMRRSLPPSQCRHILCRNPIGSPFIGPQCHSCLDKQGFAIQKIPILE